ncbi:MAG: siderophore-interacting protein [Microbacterium sp.]|uniref:siderophore-interacting protein n=1 Tax=Microbacterium sp. TaxID=51671 RepID=UPI001AC06343|nr:siderophore-interacting protein [Microbacterium sp.]MBN9174761.1 siderophore-interacting protein [Microbacterium sp.]
MAPSETVTRPAYRPYRIRVAEVRRLTPHFVRVTFTGDDLGHFGLGRLDQRVKVVLPRDDGGWADFGQDDGDGDWYARWRGLPVEIRNPFRTYTVRRIDPDAAELDIDFVVHHDAGPAGAWAEAARIGDEVVVVGPDERSPQSRVGIDWHPGTATRFLLAGDETAAPAICAILESLPETSQVDAIIEVPTAADALPLSIPAGFRVTWLGRGDGEHGEALIGAVTEWTRAHRGLLEQAAAPRRQELEEIDVDRDLLWDSPEDGDGEFYAWIAGESATVKTLRRHLVSGCGVDRRRVAFMGYWRRGRVERTE